jgi:hypothetical protein
MGKTTMRGNELSIMLCERKCTCVCPSLKKGEGMGMDIDLFAMEPWHQPELTFRLLGFVLDPALPLSLDAETKSLGIT